MSMPIPLTAVPQSPDGYYAINNQYLAQGPKGFSEVKNLENGDVFVRIDLPGVPDDGVEVSLGLLRKAIIVYGDAPKTHKHDVSDRNYIIGLFCERECGEICRFTSQMSNGVLRLVLSMSLINTHTSSSCISFLTGSGTRGEAHRGTDPNDPTLTGPELKPHPWVVQGSDMAYESKQLENGSLYLRLDMPGVPKGNFTVSVDNGRVRVTGQAPVVSHDSSPRFYSGDVAMFPTPVDIPSRRIKRIVRNGVIRLLIPQI